jgi:hypothetical protein
LVEVGGAAFDTHSLFAIGGGFKKNTLSDEGFEVQSLARISNNGCTWQNGPLTQWHAESSLQWFYHNCPADAYDVSVEEVFTVQSKEVIAFRCDRYEGRGGATKIKPTKPLFVGHWAGTAGGISCSNNGPVDDPSASVLADTVLQGWGFNISADDVPVLLLPAPISGLVAKHRWRRILLLNRWNTILHYQAEHRRRRTYGPLQGWPPDNAGMWHQQHALQNNDLDIEHPLNSTVLRNMADELRSLSTWIDVGPQSERNVDAKSRFAAVVKNLDNWSANLAQASGALSLDERTT